MLKTSDLRARSARVLLDLNADEGGVAPPFSTPATSFAVSARFFVPPGFGEAASSFRARPPHAHHDSEAAEPDTAKPPMLPSACGDDGIEVIMHPLMDGWMVHAHTATPARTGPPNPS